MNVSSGIYIQTNQPWNKNQVKPDFDKELALVRRAFSEEKRAFRSVISNLHEAMQKLETSSNETIQAFAARFDEMETKIEIPAKNSTQIRPSPTRKMPPTNNRGMLYKKVCSPKTIMYKNGWFTK